MKSSEKKKRSIISGKKEILLRVVVLFQVPIIRLQALMIRLVLPTLQVPMTLQVLHQVRGQVGALTVAVLQAVGKYK